MDKIFKAVKQDGAFFFVITILNLPIMLQAFVENKEFLPSGEKVLRYSKDFFVITAMIFILTLALNFLLAKKKKLKKLIQRTVTAIFGLMFASEFFYLSRFKQTLKTDTAEIFMENLFEPKVLAGTVFFGILLVIGVQDLQKIFKSMSAHKIERLTFSLIIFFVCGIIFLGVIYLT